jgi:hypothetical protein
MRRLRSLMPGTGGRLPILCISFMLYVLACATPALVLHTGSRALQPSGERVWTSQGYETITGLELLFAGVFGLLRMNFAGLANPLLWLSWLLLGRKKYDAAVAVSIVALLLSMQTFQLIVDPFLFDEGGVKLGYLSSVRLGFLSWIASMVWVVAGGLRMRRAAG